MLPIPNSPSILPSDLKAVVEDAALRIEHLPHRKSALSPSNNGTGE